MKTQMNKVDSSNYRLARNLTEFQEALYTHLVDWKRTHLTKEAGTYRGQAYDTILPDNLNEDITHNLKNGRYPIYQPIVKRLLEHKEKLPFKFHQYIGHMTSSQMACFNLFLPLFQDPEIAARVLHVVKPDLQAIATDHFHGFGYRLEFWDGQGKEKGLLQDHSLAAGTDADIAIAYLDINKKLNLWLIEHKLSEQGFSPCKAHNSRGRTAQHDCTSIAKLLKKPELCYYDSGRGYHYWKIMLQHQEVFSPEELLKYSACPFKNGLNQLWRNQLLGLAVEQEHIAAKLPYHKVYFSVVHHPKNTAITKTIQEYQRLIRNNERFFSFTSDCIINVASKIQDVDIQKWTTWYKDLYYY
jgi:hypothetical protein